MDRSSKELWNLEEDAHPVNPTDNPTFESVMDRILTTHVGSLPRPGDLLEMIQAKEQGRLHDQAAPSMSGV